MLRSLKREIPEKETLRSLKRVKCRKRDAAQTKKKAKQLPKTAGHRARAWR